MSFVITIVGAPKLISNNQLYLKGDITHITTPNQSFLFPTKHGPLCRCKLM